MFTRTGRTSQANSEYDAQATLSSSSRESGTENVGLEPNGLLPTFALVKHVQYPHW